MNFLHKCFVFTLLISSFNFAQNDKDDSVHQFNIIYQVESTPVSSQDKTGTCWCFATQSYLETELLRMGKGEYNLSEMFVVRNTFPLKAEKYIRYHGLSNFGQGGQAHDVLLVMENFGLVPEEVYTGKPLNEEKHNHSEMTAVLKGALDAVINTKGKISPNWKEVCESVLDIYLGEIPETFIYNEEEYTPRSFADMLGLNPDDYIEITSYQHHPYYEKFVLEIPDNWTNTEYYNIPIDELMQLIDYAIENGYSVAWDGDTSEKTFYRKKGYAVIPIDEDDTSESEDEEMKPEVEKVITQEMREETFNSFLTTDDHLMHITGIAENQEGTKFYYTKNSWGTKYKYDGYWYMSESFVRLKTIAIMVHKDAVPQEIRAKLGI